MLLRKEEVKLVGQLILNCPVCRWVSELMKNETLQVKMKKSRSAAVLAAKSGCWGVKHLKLRVLIKFCLYLNSVTEDG